MKKHNVFWDRDVLITFFRRKVFLGSGLIVLRLDICVEHKWFRQCGAHNDLTAISRFDLQGIMINQKKKITANLKKYNVDNGFFSFGFDRNVFITSFFDGFFLFENLFSIF